MAYDAEKLAALTDGELTSLETNVARLSLSGTAPQKTEASRLGPLIEQERATRKANKPPPARAARKTKPKPDEA